ncbi:hypothetical protein [Leisingera thetidis]|uniref:hypothetical protein n=1 Tax=Leisingera thetidis TaxID=2930199 RepID=UPI0021F75642|nr:hypothetical protein [Leisingera thetidis]
MKVSSQQIQKERPPEAADRAVLLPVAQAMQVCAEVWGEACKFTMARLDEYVKTQHCILGCISLDEIQLVQWRHVQKMMDDYHEEAGRMARYWQGLPETPRFQPAPTGHRGEKVIEQPAGSQAA